MVNCVYRGAKPHAPTKDQDVDELLSDFGSSMRKPSSMMVGRTAGLHHNPAHLAVAEEQLETGPAEPMTFDNMPSCVRHSDLENVLCQIHADSRSIHEWTPLARDS